MTYKPGYEYVCRYCGDDNILDYYRDDEPLYCNPECAGKAVSEENNIPVECSYCGRPKSINKWTYDRNDHFFCDRDCHTGFQRQRVEVKCVICGEKEWVTPSRAEEHKTCGDEECYRSYCKEREPHAFREDVDTDEVVEMYESGMSSTEIAEEMDMSHTGVRGRLRLSDVDLREPGYPKKVETSFGLKVRSRHERDVAENLHNRGIDFSYEPDFPGPYIPDFTLHDGTVIEVWGVVGDEEYDSRRKEKKEWYQDNGYDVIDVYPDESLEKLQKEIT